MKKTVSILLSLIMLLSAVSYGGVSACAADESEEVKPLTLNETYEEAFEKTDDYDKKSKCYYDYFEFSIPADGKITFTVKSKKKGYTSKYARYMFMDQNSDKFWSPDNTKFSGKWSTKLKKGDYFFAAEYKKTSDKNGAMLGGTYDFKISYKPTMTATVFSSLKAKKGGFKATWQKTKSVTGYQVEYSTKKDFSKFEQVKIKGAKNLEAVVTELKNEKKYYVRVRNYKTLKLGADKKKNYYSSWSKTKTIKTK